jgi:plastocyanin
MNLGNLRVRRKGNSLDLPGSGKASIMQRLLCLAASLLVAGSFARPAVAQKTHVISFRADTVAKDYRIQPGVTVVHANDVVVFKVTGGAPHNITFEASGLSPQARAALNEALPRRAGDLTGPLLTAGAEYRLVVPALPAGSYRFYCLPHRAYDERGELRVE